MSCVTRAKKRWNQTLGNVAHIENLRKQKVSTALALFDMNLTTTLKDDYGEVEKGTWAFLKILMIA